MKKTPFIEPSPIPVKTEKDIFEGLINDENINKRDNSYIEASPIPVKSDKEIPSDIINNSIFNKRENPYIESFSNSSQV